jgi:uncharacterized membrane protein
MSRHPTLAVAPMVLLAGCGNGNDTIWTGLSGVIIFGLIAMIVLHYLRRNK